MAIRLSAGSRPTGPPTRRASLTFGGVVGGGHQLVAGEAHLWGRQVGTELLWLQLDSIVVFVGRFLARVRESLESAAAPPSPGGPLQGTAPHALLPWDQKG